MEQLRKLTNTDHANVLSINNFIIHDRNSGSLKIHERNSSMKKQETFVRVTKQSR